MASFLDITKRVRRVTIFLEENEKKVLTLDASVFETHTGNAVVTDYPVEVGADITDHIRREHEILDIRGVVSNQPIAIGGPLLANTSVSGGSRLNRAEDAYEFLKNTKDSGKLVGIATTLRNYRNMAILGLGVTRDKESGNIVNLSLNFREIITSQTESVNVADPNNKSRKGQSDLGRKQKTETSPATSVKVEDVLDNTLGSQATTLGL